MLHCLCLVLCLLQKQIAAAVYNCEAFSLKPTEIKPTLRFEIHQKVGNKKKEQYRKMLCVGFCENAIKAQSWAELSVLCLYMARRRLKVQSACR